MWRRNNPAADKKQQPLGLPMLSSAPCLQKSEVQKSNENASVPKSNSLEANKQFKSILFCAPFERSAASNIMNRVVDFLTQNWDYGPEVCLAAFAFFHSARVSKANITVEGHP